MKYTLFVVLALCFLQNVLHAGYCGHRTSSFSISVGASAPCYQEVVVVRQPTYVVAPCPWGYFGQPQVVYPVVYERAYLAPSCHNNLSLSFGWHWMR